MNIYKVTRQPMTWSYDKYDSFVCVAESEDAARNTHPYSDGWEYGRGCWIGEDDKSSLTVELIGVPDVDHQDAQIILASFNAG